jgi:phosphoglycolate phosphatase
MSTAMSPAPTRVIFDFDNTLIDSRIDFTALRRALVNQMARAGVAGAGDTLLRLPIPEIVTHAQTAAPEITEALWSTIERFEENGMRDATVMPHTYEVLTSLRARGDALAVLTNNARPATTRMLARHDLDGYFDLTVTRDDVPAMKPDPAGVRYILARTRPGTATVLVGDSWIDGRAASDAGVCFIGFGGRRAEVEARGVRPWAWITDLRELLALDWTA